MVVMANHYTTVCTVTGPAVAVSHFIIDHIRDDEGEKAGFDLSTVIAKPDIVDKTESGSEATAGFFALTGLHKVSFAMFDESPMHLAARHKGFPMHAMTSPDEYRAWLAKENPEALEKGRLSLECFRETGYLGWREWSYANWGTKWNSYDFARRSREPEKFVFQFDTANGFPEPVFDRLAELHPELTFDVVTIDEGGPEYEGRYSAAECRFEKKEHSPERYRLVYGRDPYSDEDDEEEATEQPS